MGDIVTKGYNQNFWRFLGKTRSQRADKSEDEWESTNLTKYSTADWTVMAKAVGVGTRNKSRKALLDDNRKKFETTNPEWKKE